MTTKNSTLPGFTAEAALFNTRHQYREVLGSTSFGESIVTPQRPDEICDLCWELMLEECVGGMNRSCFHFVYLYSSLCGFPQ